MSGVKETGWDESDVQNFLTDMGIGTGIFYDELDTSTSLSGYYEYCSSAKKPLSDNRLVKIVCATVLKYLETKYSKLDHTNDAYDSCKLLNYWAYKRLNIVLHSNDSNYINRAHGDILLKWNDFNEHKLNNPDKKTCKPMGNIVAYNDFEKRKELYDYYVDYSTIIQYLKYYPQLCNNFYKYVKSKKPLYTYFKERCTRKDINMCPEFFDQYEKYDPDKVLPHSDCKGVIMQETATAASRLPQLRNGPLGSETESEETNGPMRTFDAPKFNGKSQTVENVGNILLGVVATTMTSGALYRFTPLGGMIRNGLGWNTNNMRNFNEGDIRLYDYASEPFNPYPGEEHYIGYHPA
ncbi:PIR protein [Plasmodium vivax]|uniref:VIR protein n=1 Tax=Plasmodium vivax TaxID=5855 RepID=A0A565A587_PLAVI|nr:PIR protein [Plasmodium vivax]